MLLWLTWREMLDMSSFESKKQGYALQREEKIDLIYMFLRELAKDRFPDIYEKVKEEWMKE